jgi:DME family drug/metabolite transporter
MHIAFIALAALCWGVSGGIAGMLITAGWQPLVVSFYRGAIGLLCVLVWLALRPRNSGLTNPRLWLWSAVAGVGVAGNFICYFLSIRFGSVAVAATLMYCAPVFVYLLSFTLQLERPTTLKWAAIGLVLLGVLLLTSVHMQDTASITTVAVATGLLAGLCYSVFIFAFKYAAPHGSPQAILLIAFTVMVGMLLWPGDSRQLVAVPFSTSWPLFIVLGLLGAGLSFLLYIIGLKNTPPTAAAIAAMVEPVSAALFAVVVLHERLSAQQMLGMALILLTVTALSVTSAGRTG